MTDLHLSLRLSAEFAQAKTEIAELRERMRSLGLDAGSAGAAAGRAGAEIASVAPKAAVAGKAVAGAGADAALTKEQLAALAGGWTGLAVTLNPVIGAALRFEEAEQLVTQAVAAQVVSADAGAAALEKLAAKLGLVDTSEEAAAAAAREAQAAYASLLAGLDPLEAASQRFAQVQEVVGRAVATGAVSVDAGAAALERYAIKLGLAEDMGERQAQEAARLTASWSSLRASVDPAVAAEQRFAEAQTMVNRAIAVGVVSAAEGKAALDGLAGKLGLVEGAAEGAAGAQMRLKAHSSAAAAQMGNLASQWNDVVMMALAGQNPMQLAIQQGTQITQVFGGAGASGALRMLGASALSLLNPFNLLVIGGVAAGAALVQAFMGAGDEAKTVEEAVGDLETAVSDLRTEAGRDLKALKEDFGEVTPEVRELQDALTRLAATNALQSTGDAMKALRAETQGSWWEIFSGEFTDAGAREKLIGDQPYVPTQLGNGLTGLSQPTADRFLAALDAGVGAEGLAAQLTAIEEVKAAFLDATKGQDSLTEAQRTFLKGVLDTEVGLRRLIAAQLESVRAGGAQKSATVGELAQGGGRRPDAAARETARDNAAEASRMRAELKAEADIQAVISRYGEDSWRVTEARVAAERQAFQVSLVQLGVSGQELRNDMARWDAAKGIVAAREKLQQTVIDPAATALDRVDKAQAQISALERQAELERLVADYGEDSLVVTLARVAAEREVFEEQQRAAGQSGVMLDNLMEAWDAAEGLASVDVGAQIAAALGPASQLAEYLRQAASYWGAAQGLLQRASESGGWIGGIVSRLGLGATPQAPMTSPPPRTRPDGFGVDMDGDGIPDATQTGAAGGGRGAGGAGRAKGTSLASLQAEARELMTEMDRDIAAIAEKLRAGLIDQSEATEAVRQAKERAAGRLAELIPQLQAMGKGGAEAVELWRDQLDGLADDLKDAGDLSETMSEGFKGVFKGFAQGAQEGQQAMDAFADHVLDKLLDLASDQLWTSVLEPLANGLFSGLGLTASAKGNVFRAGAIVPFAEGGAPAAPLSAWSNRVVSRPTLFAMAGGLGVMGEGDGEEAIMPLGGGGVLALRGGAETRLPLIRSAAGRLGVDLDAMDGWRPDVLDRAPAAFALGGRISGGSERDVDRMGSARLRTAVEAGAAGAPAAASAQAVPDFNLAVHVQGVPAGHTARVEESGAGQDRMVRIIIDQVGAALAGELASGRGPLAPVLSRKYGLGRVPE